MFSARERAVRVMDRDEAILDVVYHNGKEIALGWKEKEKENNV